MIIKSQRKTILAIADIAGKKGIDNAHQLHLRTGISIPRAKRLWAGKGQIRTKDIDALCDNLPCKVQDIFRRIPKSLSDNK